MSWQEIPKEIKVFLLSYLNARDLARVQLTSRDMYHLAKLAGFWKYTTTFLSLYFLSIFLLCSFFYFPFFSFSPTKMRQRPEDKTSKCH
jgi:hypothetical protein